MKHDPNRLLSWGHRNRRYGIKVGQKVRRKNHHLAIIVFNNGRRKFVGTVNGFVLTDEQTYADIQLTKGFSTLVSCKELESYD